MCGCINVSLVGVFTDGNIPEGDTLSPTDIEANLSTEVSLTVLDVLGLFVQHHKVTNPPSSSACNIVFTFLTFDNLILSKRSNENEKKKWLPPPAT